MFFPTWVCQAFSLGNDTMETLPMDREQAEQVLEAVLKTEDIKDIQDTEMVMDGEKKGEKDKNYYDPEKYQYPDNQLGLTPSPSPKKEVAETETEDSVTTTEPETTPKPHLEVSPEPSAPGSLESVDKEKEEDGKEKDLPMVTREAQQAFKEKGSRVSKSDAAAAAAPAKTNGKDAKKRTAAAKKGPEKPKSKQPKKIMAEPVEVVEDITSDDDQGDLASDLEEVASDQVEKGSPGPAPNTRARTKAPSGTSQPKARTTAKAKAAAKNVTMPKDKKSRASTKNHVPVEERANGVKEKKSGKKNDKETGKKQKKTFAGRRCPECGPSLFRFRAMEKIYDEDVAPKLSISVGMAEDRQLPTPGTPVWDHCFSTQSRAKNKMKFPGF